MSNEKINKKIDIKDYEKKMSDTQLKNATDRIMKNSYSQLFYEEPTRYERNEGNYAENNKIILARYVAR